MIRLQSTLDALFVSLIAIVIGYVSGWQIGALREVRTRDRIALAAAVSLIGGIILTVLISFLIYPDTFYGLETVGAMATGLILGAITHWRQSTPEPYRPRVVYEPDTDEEFDREIKRALGGEEKSKQHIGSKASRPSTSSHTIIKGRLEHRASTAPCSQEMSE